MRSPRVIRRVKGGGVVTTGRVLTTELVPGVHIDRVAAMPQRVRDAVGTTLLRLTLRELFQWRFMQVPHIFNILLFILRLERTRRSGSPTPCFFLFFLATQGNWPERRPVRLARGLLPSAKSNKLTRSFPLS